MSQASRPTSIRHTLLIHFNACALLLPSFAQLALLKCLHPPTMKTAFVSGIFAIFANVALGVLSSKYGVTKPLHEAGASVITAHVAFAVLTDYPSFSTAWRLFYIICAIPITKSIWKAALYLAGWARLDNREAKLPTCVGESKGLCSVTKDVNDDMYKEKPFAP